MKAWKIAIFSLLGLMLLLFALFLGVATPVVNSLLQNWSEKLKKENRLIISYGDVRISNLLDVDITAISANTEDGKIRAEIKKIRLRLAPLSYLWGSLPIRSLDIDTPQIFAQLQPSSDDSFPQLKLGIKEIHVHHGRFHFQQNDKEAVFANVDVDLKRIKGGYFASLITGESLVSLSKDVYVADECSLQLFLRGRDLLHPKQIELAHSILITPELKLGMSGNLLWQSHAKNRTPQGDFLTYGEANLSALSQHMELPVSLMGQVSWAGRLQNENPAVGWQFGGDIQAKNIEVDDMKFRSLVGETIINKRFLELQHGLVNIAGTRAQAAWRMEFDDKIHFALNADAGDASLYDLLSELGIDGAWTDLGMNVHAEARGQFLPKFELSGRAEVEAHGLIVADGPVRKATDDQIILRGVYPVHLAADLFVTADYFRFEHAVLNDGLSAATVDCTLFFDKNKGMVLEGQFSRADFASIDNKIADNQYEGQGQIDVSIFGPYEDLTIVAPASVDHFTFEKYYFGQVKGEVKYHGDRLTFNDVSAMLGASRYEGQLEFSFEDDLWMDLDVKIVRATGQDLRRMIPRHSPIKILEYVAKSSLTGDLVGSIHLEGPVKEADRHRLMGHIDIKSLPKGSIYGMPLDEGILKVRFETEQAIVDKFTLDSPVFLFDLQGEMSKGSGELSLQMGVKRLNLSLPDMGFLSEMRPKGQVDISANIGGTTNNLAMKANILVSDAELFDATLGNVELDVELNDGVLLAKGPILSTKGYADLRFDIKDDMPFSGLFRMQYSPLKPIFSKADFPEHVEFFAGASVEFKGHLNNLQRTKGSIVVYPATLTYGGLKLISSGEIKAGFDGEIVDIERLVLQTSHGDSLRVKGRVMSTAMNLQLKALGDLWILPFLDERIESAYGDFFADVTLSGDFANPVFQGVANVDRGFISIRDYPPPIEELTLSGKFANQKLHISVLRGQVKKGFFEGQGDLWISRYVPQEYDLRFRFEDIPIHYSSWISGSSSGKLELKGKKENLLLSGDVRILEALMTREIDWDKIAADFAAPNVLVRTQGSGKPLQFDVHISGNKGIRVESHSLQAELNADLRLVGTKEAPGLQGTLSAVSGDAYFRNHHYRLLKARADFYDPYRISPRLDIEAEGNIGEYSILARLEGTLFKPRFQLTTRPSLPESDVLSLMTLGFTNREMKNVVGTARTASLEALSAYSGIGPKIARMINVDELRLTSLFSHRGGVSLPALMVGVDVWRGMRLRLQSALVENDAGSREQRFELEQSLNKDVRWRLVWNSEGLSNYGDAGIDLWYRWEF